MRSYFTPMSTLPEDCYNYLREVGRADRTLNIFQFAERIIASITANGVERTASVYDIPKNIVSQFETHHIKAITTAVDQYFYYNLVEMGIMNKSEIPLQKLVNELGIPGLKVTDKDGHVHNLIKAVLVKLDKIMCEERDKTGQIQGHLMQTNKINF